MNIALHVTGLSPTPAMQTTAVKKFSRLARLVARHAAENPLINLELSRTTHHHHKGKIFRVEAHLVIGKTSVYAAAECDDIYEGIDHCVAAVKKQLVRLKERD